MYTSCGFQSNLQIQSSLARAVTVDSEAATKTRTLHTLNVSGHFKKDNGRATMRKKGYLLFIAIGIIITMIIAISIFSIKHKYYSMDNFKIPFSKGWIDISNENPNGPPSFIKDLKDNPGVLQISHAEYLSGKLPNPSYDDLVELSKNIGQKNDFGEIVNKSSGDCNYGKYGFVEFKNKDFPFISVWHISDSKNFIFVTYICSVKPDPDEISEVYGILKNIKKKWLGFL